MQKFLLFENKCLKEAQMSKREVKMIKNHNSTLTLVNKNK